MGVFIPRYFSAGSRASLQDVGYCGEIDMSYNHVHTLLHSTNAVKGINTSPYSL